MWRSSMSIVISFPKMTSPFSQASVITLSLSSIAWKYVPSSKVAVGTSKAQGFGQAQQLAAQAAQQQLGLAGQSQQMGMGDISAMMQAGAQQQGLTQQGYDEAYRRSLQQMYEPFQRMGYASDIMQGAPTSASALTMATTPQANPISQAVGAGISGLALYQGYQNAGNTAGNIVNN